MRARRGLYCRLFQRKGPWFRVDGLAQYEELLPHYKHEASLAERRGRAQAALAELVSAGLLVGLSNGPEPVKVGHAHACTHRK